MRKLFLTLTVLFFAGLISPVQAQTREELEKQKKQLKDELEQQQKLLNEINGKTKTSIGEYAVVKNKIDIQGRIINTISKDINLINNDIYRNQREINKLNLILDTLRQQYSASMVYAYKNRNNYDFLNFIFSAESFNDAIKRVAYLKSYRNYRELQGQNILLTQELLRQRMAEQSGNKQKKSVALGDQNKELSVLEKEEDKKKEIVNKFKAQGKEVAKQIDARKKQLNKVTNAINVAIKKAIEDARKREKPAVVVTPTSPKNPKIKTAPVKKDPEAIPMNSQEVELAADFKNTRGRLPWPVEKGYILMHYGRNDLPDGGVIVNPGVTIGTSIGSPVKAIFNGTVTKVVPIENMQMVIIQHGSYFTSYSNLGSASVQAGQTVTTGQVIGKVGVNDDGLGSVDLLLYGSKGQDNPENWLHK